MVNNQTIHDSLCREGWDVTKRFMRGQGPVNVWQLASRARKRALSDLNYIYIYIYMAHESFTPPPPPPVYAPPPGGCGVPRLRLASLDRRLAALDAGASPRIPLK